MKRLVDYARVINNTNDYGKVPESKNTPLLIVNDEGNSSSTRDAMGSRIDTITIVYKFDDGVQVKYIRENDDGTPYPGSREVMFIYEILNAQEFEFTGEIREAFHSSSALQKWLKQDL